MLARWDEGYTDPWLILTDLEPTEGDALWYSLRSWIECSYRDVKSDGWQWQRTRLRNPQRAERHWLAMAIATLWMVTLGGYVDQHEEKKLGNQLPPNHVANRRPRPLRPARQISCFLQGLLTILADLLNGKTISLAGLCPQPWPNSGAISFNSS